MCSAAGDTGLPRPEDSLTWALQALQAATRAPDLNRASDLVHDLLAKRDEVEVRDIAAALAVLPLLAARPLTDRGELDRLAAAVSWTSWPPRSSGVTG